MKHDIETRKDIELLVDRFYEKVLHNDRIKHFFTDVAHIDLKAHLPTMYNFWETLLLGSYSYKGQPIDIHMALNRQSTLSKEHFDAWLGLWKETIDEHFSGPKADEAKARAESVSNLMMYKIKST